MRRADQKSSKKMWAKPEVRTIRAGSAEDALGTAIDAITNPS